MRHFAFLSQGEKERQKESARASHPHSARPFTPLKRRGFPAQFVFAACVLLAGPPPRGGKGKASCRRHRRLSLRRNLGGGDEGARGRVEEALAAVTFSLLLSFVRQTKESRKSANRRKDMESTATISCTDVKSCILLLVHCPRCKSTDTSVIDSRLSEEGRSVRRRRECPKCEHRFTTFERQELSSFIVVKRDGTREPYTRTKIERGIWIACTKRPVTQEKIDSLLTKLEEKWGANKKEVSSSTIGMDVMRELKKIDQVAYIRFASVHREFKDVEEFKEELGRLFK